MIRTVNKKPPTVNTVNSGLIELSAWAALVWAYRDECVLAASNRAGPRRDLRSAAQGMVEAGEGPLHLATVHGSLEAHEDAFAIDAFVLKELPVKRDGKWDRDTYVRITRAAAMGVPIAPSLDLPEPEWVPKLNKSGAPKAIYDHNRNKIGVEMEWRDSFSPENRDWQQQSHASFHRLFIDLLGAMEGRWFGARVICGIGLTDYAIWLTPSQRSVLRRRS